LLYKIEHKVYQRLLANVVEMLIPLSQAHVLGIHVQLLLAQQIATHNDPIEALPSLELL